MLRGAGIKIQPRFLIQYPMKNLIQRNAILKDICCTINVIVYINYIFRKEACLIKLFRGKLILKEYIKK